ncbi:MAG: hypothetical protein IJ457_06225 [Clostridia bacterium]|nr:hypothetical protein [Clostridia bacterium]
MKLDFRIDWGYQYLYSRRLYHPTFIWDGDLTVDGGKIDEIYQLTYPYSWYGIGHSAKETKLDSPAWKSTTKRGLSGIRIVADVDEGAVFHLNTMSGSFDFTAKDIIEKGKLDFPVGPKYLGCSVLVTRTGYIWFRPESLPGQTIWNAEDLGLDVHPWARCDLAWLRPGETVKFKYTVPEKTKDVSDTVIHTVGMGAPEFDPVAESQVDAMIPFELYCDGEKVAEWSRYYRRHDYNLQLLEDAWITVNVPAGEHEFELKNLHNEVCFAISRITAKQAEMNHGQLLLPGWALVGETLKGKVYSTSETEIKVDVFGEEITVDCKKGWNEFAFTPGCPRCTKIKTATDEKTIEVYDISEETVPVKVGYDCTTVPHDDTGFMDWLLDYTQGTRLGNYIMFRSFNGDVPDELLRKWGEYCKEHGMYAAACNNYLSGALAEGAGDMFHDCGQHEYPGTVYAYDPTPEDCSESMKEAKDKFLAHLKIEIDKAHTVCDTAAFGDASGGIRYSYLAGADFVRAETMVGPTMPLLSQARGAADSLGDGTWGVHIAIMHCYEPYKESHIGQYFLCIMQPWAMGAETIYEEDSLFNIFTEERIAWDDLLTKGKRDMTRSFFKFAKTHPRKGKNVRNIGFIEGRYAAPFNGFICDTEQDPHYSVWGKYGSNAPEWGHCQPEKCHQVLDVLMPGTSTHPFLQKHDKRRFFFAGTPYGDFDSIPVEASADYYDNYKLLLNLGWNTMIPEDYDKLKSYVAKGGTLLTGLPQFSTHEKRDFLRDMEDLALMNGGDLSELCGIKVSRGETVYCGQWNCADRNSINVPELSAMPSDCPCEDGKPILADVELCGAEIVAWDSYTGKPLLVKYKYGEGEVYTFTFWAYPGHEQFMSFSAAWVARLAEKTLPEIYVTDESGEVFWTRWVDGETTQIMLLNTDWTEKGNVKNVTLHTGDKEVALAVKERTLLTADIVNGEVTVNEYEL